MTAVRTYLRATSRSLTLPRLRELAGFPGDVERDLDVPHDEGAPGGRRCFSQWALQEVGAHDEPTEPVVLRLWQRLQPAESSFTALRLAGCPLHFAITQDVTIADGGGRTSFVLPPPFVRFLGALETHVEFDQHVT